MRRRIALALLMLVGCSPLIRVQVDFAVQGIETPDPARLHVRGRKACDPSNLSKPRATPPEAPPPGLAEVVEDRWPPQESGPVAFQREGMIARTEFDESKCYLAIAAFYDANGDERVGPGDFTATMPAAEVVDRGVLRGNMNDLGTIVLEPL